VLFPLLFLSGAFFPINELPVWLKVIGRVNPLSYGVDLLQLTLYARDTGGYSGVPLDLAVLAVLAVVVFVLGSGRSASLER
jgi:ABC-2 type transport system permease protein